MASYSVNAYSGGASLSQAQMLAWNGATVTSFTATQIRLQVRDGGAVGLPGDYDLILVGSFTILGGLFTGGTVSAIIGKPAGAATTLATISGLNVNLGALATSLNPPAFSSPSLTTLFSGADTLNGNSGDDTLQGAGGVDTMNGGVGDDTFVYQAGQAVAGETVNGGGDSDTISVSNGTYDFRSVTLTSIENLAYTSAAAANAIFDASQIGTGLINNITGSAGVNTLTIVGANVDLSSLAFTNWGIDDLIKINGSSSGAEVLTGTVLRDTIIGNAGQDTITGNGGRDILSGLGGDDTFIFDSGDEIAVGLTIGGGGDTDEIALNAGFQFDFTSATITSVERVVFLGTSYSVSFLGGHLGVGGITIFDNSVGAQVEVTVEGASADLSTLALTGFGSSASFFLPGTAGNDVLTGSSATDVFDGTNGVDTLHGGLGDDRFNYREGAQIGTGEIIDGGGGNFDSITLQAGVDFVVFDFRNASITDIEGLIFSSAVDSRARFTSAQILDIGLVQAGQGADTLTIDVATFADLSGLPLFFWSAADRVFLVGNGGNNTIVGTSQADIFDAGGGSDVLHGGQGNDDFRYLANGEAVAGEQLHGEGGSDEIIVGNNITVDLSVVAISSVETLNFLQNNNTVTMAGGQFGAGAIANLRGGSGTDTLIVAGATTNLSGVAITNWNDLVDTITLNGTAAADFLTGSAVADTLNGGLLGDTMRGGLGNDTYFVDNAGDFTDEITGGGGTLDRVFSSISFSAAAGIEQLTLTGTANINAVGRNGQVDTLIGNSGDNILNGLSGADIMRGGAGNDTYVVDDIGDTTDETSNGGAGTQDFVLSSVSFTAALGIERLTLTGTADINAIGRNGQIDTLVGNSGNNILNGLSGADTMRGGQGNDTYFVDDTGDFTDEVNGGGGVDTVRSFVTYSAQAGIEFVILQGTDAINGIGRNGQNDDITGNNGINVLNGLSGDDTLDGGLSDDSLVGGAGFDIFQFTTSLGVPNMDTVIDYSIAEDSIQLDNAVFTLLTATGALAANLFKNLALGAQDADDVIIYDQTTGALFYDSNGLTAGGQTQFADLTNGLALTESEFTVI